MPPTSLALETEILFRISLAIGDSMQLGPMTRKVLSETLRLLNASGAAVYACDGGALQPVCVLPRTFEQAARFAPVRALWPARETFAGRGWTSVELAGVFHHLLDLPDFGLLAIERAGKPLDAGFLDSFVPLARKLANACRACIGERMLAREKQRLEMATAAAALGVWSLNTTTGQLEWDARMCDLHRVVPNDFGGRLGDWLSRLDPVDGQRFAASIAAATAASSELDEDVTVLHAEGERRVLRVLGRASAGSLAGVVLDVTARRETNDALRRARDAAEAASRAKSDFLANMSHEIRTPMNGVLGMLDLARDAVSDAELRECVAIARSSAETLLGIINDILDFSKIEAGKIDIESLPCDVRDLLAVVVRTMSAQASAKGLALQLELADDLPERLLGDPLRIRQVVLNLLGNAIKFTAHGRVTVSARIEHDTDGAMLSVAVADTGIGIPPDKHAQVFEAFAQQDSSTTRSYGGTGLGLSISSALARLMGGRIELDSAPGKGSVFRLMLPLRPATVAAPLAGATDEPPRMTALDVLLVEDNAINQKVAQAALTRVGHRVTIASNGVEAIEQVSDVRFDLVLMDMQMPVMGGIEATRQIRQLERELGRPPVPILAMTANALEEDRQACLDAGMNEFLTKPLLPRVLRERIHALFG